VFWSSPKGANPATCLNECDFYSINEIITETDSFLFFGRFSFREKKRWLLSLKGIATAEHKMSHSRVKSYLCVCLRPSASEWLSESQIISLCVSEAQCIWMAVVICSLRRIWSCMTSPWSSRRMMRMMSSRSVMLCGINMNSCARGAPSSDQRPARPWWPAYLASHKSFSEGSSRRRQRPIKPQTRVRIVTTTPLMRQCWRYVSRWLIGVADS